MATRAGLAMSSAERHKRDALALAGRVRANEVTGEEVSAQAAEAVGRFDPLIEAVFRSYKNAVVNPDIGGPSNAGQLYGVPMLLKDLGSRLVGRTQESGDRPFRDHFVHATGPLVAH